MLHLYKALTEIGLKTSIIAPRYNMTRMDTITRIWGLRFRPSVHIVHTAIDNFGSLTRTIPNSIKMLMYDVELIKYIKNLKVSLQHNGLKTIVIASSIYPLGGVDIVYMHYPAAIALNADNITTKLYRGFIRSLEDLAITSMPRIVLTNSTWTAERIRETYGSKLLHSSLIQVLYPPIDLESYLHPWHNSERKKYVVTIAAFSREKRLECIVRLAKVMPSYKFFIIGGAENYRYYSMLKKYLKQHDINNVILLPNAPSTLVRRILRDAKYYVHPPIAEHFGIAIAEAMASGLIPIVYKDGGAWTDIVSRISKILGYKTIDDIPQVISNIEHENLCEEFKLRELDLVKLFSYENFKNRLGKIVHSLVAANSNMNG